MSQIMGTDAELDRFKTDINLVEYAASLGYSLESSRSCRNSAALTSQDGDKIVIATAPDGHGIYFSVRDGSDNGSIIDFVQRRKGLTLGGVRRELRRFQRSPVPEVIASRRHRKPVASSKDRQRVIQAFAACESCPQHPYLVSRLFLPEHLLDSRFKGAIFRDKRNNAIFPHYDGAGLCGYEIKNRGFTGFASGGEKGLWFTSNVERASCIYFGESAIDVLGYSQLYYEPEAAYASFGGSLSPSQHSLLQTILGAAMTRGQRLVLAVDDDLGGDSFASIFRGLVADEQKIHRVLPAAKDFVEQLRESQAEKNPQMRALD